MIVRQDVSKEDLKKARANANKEDKRKAKKALEKRVSEHPILHLLNRAATTGELPHKDELSRLNVSAKYRKDIEAAARRIKHESESPNDADEQKTSSGRVKVKGHTSARFMARSMAFDKAEEFVSSLPSNHETQEEIEFRQKREDPEAVADIVMKRSVGR